MDTLDPRLRQLSLQPTQESFDLMERVGTRPDLTCEQIKQVLMRTARRDGLAATAPDNAWGSGKLDAQAAYAAALGVRFAAVSGVVASGATLRWLTDLPTTSAVRFSASPRHLQLLKNVESRTDLVPRTAHALTLSGVPPGLYYCEILAYTQGNWWTADDNGGAFYELQV